MGMTIEKLINELNKYPKDMEVHVEMSINGVEFDCPISEIYESEKLYIFGKDKFNVEIYCEQDGRRWE